MNKAFFAGLIFLVSVGALADSCQTEMVDYQGYVRVIFTQGQPNWTDRNCASGYNRCVESIRLNPSMRPICRVVFAAQAPQPIPNPPTRPQWNPIPQPTQPNSGSGGPPTSGRSSGRVQPSDSRPTSTRPSWNGNDNRDGQPRLEVDPFSITDRPILTDRGTTYTDTFDGKREIEIGETVIMAGAIFIVVDTDGSNIDIQKQDGNRRKKDIVRVKRDKVSVTRGCSMSICVPDMVYHIPRGKMEAVAGITMDGKLITKSEKGVINMNAVDLREVAVGKGCTMNAKNEQVCVGNTILSGNRYFTVLAIQHNQKVIIETTESSTSVLTNISPADFVVVK